MMNRQELYNILIKVFYKTEVIHKNDSYLIYKNGEIIELPYSICSNLISYDILEQMGSNFQTGPTEYILDDLRMSEILCKPNFISYITQENFDSILPIYRELVLHDILD